MKSILTLILLGIALAMFGCSSTETTQDQVEKDAAAITTDPSATPMQSPDVQQAPPIPSSPDGQQYGKKPAGG